MIVSPSTIHRIFNARCLKHFFLSTIKTVYKHGLLLTLDSMFRGIFFCSEETKDKLLCFLTLATINFAKKGFQMGKAQFKFNMNAIVIFMCSVLTTKVKSAARQCFPCIWGPDCCSVESSSNSETDAAHKIFADSDSTETYLEVQSLTAQVQKETGFIHTKMFADAKAFRFQDKYDAQQIQSLERHCCDAIESFSPEQNVDNENVCIQPKLSVLIQRKNICVLEMAANFEKDLHGCLLGR